MGLGWTAADAAWEPEDHGVLAAKNEGTGAAAARQLGDGAAGGPFPVAEKLFQSFFFSSGQEGNHLSLARIFIQNKYYI